MIPVEERRLVSVAIAQILIQKPSVQLFQPWNHRFTVQQSFLHFAGFEFNPELSNRRLLLQGKLSKDP